MQVIKLHKEFDKLQKKHGDKNLDAVYGTGCVKRPNVMFVFMNPTARNIATDKKWKGLKAQWLGTKQVWKLFFSLGFLNKWIFAEIKNKRPEDWDYNFAENVYKEVQKKKIYITNLSKATQIDARSLPDSVFNEYLSLLKKEILEINPKIIIIFGNQVSSILLKEDIRVSLFRKKSFNLILDKKKYKVYPVYYPVGQGMRNIKKVMEDLKWILKNNK